jgi:hypothetical protein
VRTDDICTIVAWIVRILEHAWLSVREMLPKREVRVTGTDFGRCLRCA